LLSYKMRGSLRAGPRIDRVIEARAQALGVSFEVMKAEYLKKNLAGTDGY
jgi:hypothetical protein